MNDSKKYTRVTVTRNNDATILISVEIAAERLPYYRLKALDHFNQSLNLPGFRKGHIPEKTIVEHIGEHTILEEAAERAIQDVYPSIIQENRIMAVGRPEATVTKLAAGNPLCFDIKTAIIPDIVLPDYRTIAVTAREKQEPVSVTPKDIEEALLSIRKMLSMQDADGKASDNIPETELPELTDEAVKTMGNFSTVAEFTDRLKEQILLDKKARAAEKLRADIGEGLLNGVTVTLPDLLIETELDKIIARLKDDAVRAGTTFEAYCKQINKTETDFRTEWRPDAEKRAVLQLILNHVAAAEKIQPDSTAIEKHTAIIRQQVKDADPESARIYVTTVLTNDAVFQFLENL